MFFQIKYIMLINIEHLGTNLPAWVLFTVKYTRKK